MTRLIHDSVARAHSGKRRRRGHLATLPLTAAVVISAVGGLAAPSAQALPDVPAPGGYATWHRVDVKTPGSWPEIVASAADGAIWYSEDSGELVRRDPASGSMTAFPLGIGSTKIVALAGAPDGALWFSDLRHFTVGRLDPASGAVYTHTFSGPGPWVDKSIAFDAAGNAWFGGSNGAPGLTVIRPDGSNEAFADPFGRYPEALTVAPNGHVWYATSDSPDIIDFDPVAETFAQVPLGSIASTGVADVEVSHDGDIWVVTDKGISNIETDGTILSTSMLPSHPFITKPTSLVPGEFAEMYFADGAGGYGRINADHSLSLFTDPFYDGGSRSIAVDGYGALWMTLLDDQLAWV